MVKTLNFTKLRPIRTTVHTARTCTAFKLHVSGQVVAKYDVVTVCLCSLFSMVINRTIEYMQMSPVAACDWSVAGKSDARFDLDIDLLA